VKTYLKVKIKALADEARTIKAEERKWFQVETVRRYREVDGKLRQVGVTRTSHRKRTEMQKANGHMGTPHPLFFGLRDHRIKVVRPEARAANLAYGFLRGRRYEQVENKAFEQPNWRRVEEIVRKFGVGDIRDIMQTFASWKDGAKDYHERMTKTPRVAA
jgi:hypothetical protein